METFVLTTPITQPSTINYKVIKLFLDWENAIIHIELRADNGLKLEYNYTGTEATNLMTILNKVNLSTNSLQHRIIDKLVQDGILPSGSISGSPD